MVTVANCVSAKDDLIGARPQRFENEEHPFYPRPILLEQFTVRKIHQIFNSYKACAKCRDDHEFLQSMKGKIDPDFDVYAKAIRPTPQKEVDLTASSVSFFALLLYIGHPLMIIPFIDRNCNDSNVLDSYVRGSFSHPDLQKHFWPDHHKSADAKKKSDLLAREIGENLFKFVRPVFGNERFTELGRNVKLPFYAEQRLGAGSFGEVFSFKIYDGHNRLPNFRNVPKFARKQIRPSDGIETLAGHLERRNLEVVKRLGNEHIVEIAFSYREIRDGQQLFNLVFPCATANLHDCLRLPEKNFNSSLYRPGPIYDCELWEQILGVANALYRIAECASEPSDEVGHDLLGYHFDLKPANILVYRRGKQWIFKITDFGQAKFKRASGANSNTRRKGGDEEYAPPEIDTADAVEQQQSRKYDVFSLGCIFLEMTSFLVRGYDGVADIDVARGKSPGPNQSDGRYCLSPTATTPALLKPQINEHRDGLLAYMQNGEMFAADEKHFIEKTLDLIWGMLQPKVSDRYASRDVVDELQALLNEEPRPSKAPNPGGFSAQQKEPLAGEKEIGQPDLGRLKLYLRSNIDPSKGDALVYLQIFENSRNQLRFVTTMKHSGRAGPGSQGLRRDIELLPQYAARRGDDMSRIDAGLRLVWAGDPQQPIMQADFNAGSLDDLRTLQGILIDQVICHSVDLEDFRDSPPFSIKGFAGRQLGKLRATARTEQNNINSTPLPENEKSPSTLQLWRDRQKSSTSHICRLVFYSAERIILIPFDDTWRLTKLEQNDQQDEERRNIKIEPTRSRREHKFQMFVLKAHGGGGHGAIPPRFPLERAAFDNLLKNCRTEFTCVDLTFRNHADLMDFWNIFRATKRAEQQERGVFLRERR